MMADFITNDSNFAPDYHLKTFKVAGRNKFLKKLWLACTLQIKQFRIICLIMSNPNPEKPLIAKQTCPPVPCGGNPNLTRNQTPFFHAGISTGSHYSCLLENSPMVLKVRR